MNLEIIEHLPKSPPHPTPLLFVHGMWHGAWCWEENFLPFFAENGYRAVALSLRGHGKSEGKIRGSKISDYVNDVAQAVSGLGARPAIIGHSMGGFITQKYLEAHDAAGGVLLASHPHYGLWPATLRVFLHSPMIPVKVLWLQRLFPAVEKPADARWMLFSADMPEEQLLKYHSKLIDESFRAYIDLLGLNLAHPKRVKAPMLILGAEKDTVIPPGDVHATARAYGVQAEIFPDMAHDMMLEAGWRSVAMRILNWLKEGCI
jgi:pimeloyl-ACP methyl ester carboxylesterase